jgi:phospholipase/lecithinase/hemolysin
MAKPKDRFIDAFEPLLLNAWGSYKDHLDDTLLKKTRDALSYIRRVYRFGGEGGGQSLQHKSTIEKSGTGLVILPLLENDMPISLMPT